jgi:hypothetical protein
MASSDDVFSSAIFSFSSCLLAWWKIEGVFGREVLESEIQSALPFKFLLPAELLCFKYSREATAFS